MPIHTMPSPSLPTREQSIVTTIAAVTLLIYEYVKLARKDVATQVELSEMNYTYNETIYTHTASGEINGAGESKNYTLDSIMSTPQDKLISRQHPNIDIVESPPTLAINPDNPELVPSKRRWMCGTGSRRRRYIKTINHAISTLQETSEGRVVFFLNNKKTDLQVGITINDVEKRIIVVFRGSKSLTNYKYNLSLCQKKLECNIAVHSGFYNQLYHGRSIDFINDKVMQLLCDHPTYTLYCTGHSMGGSVATLYGYLLTKRRSLSTNVIIVSFGAPRLGNGAFKTDFEAISNLSHIRVTNKYDLVTKMPWMRYHDTGMNLSTGSLLIANSNKNTNRYRYVYVNHSMSTYYTCVTNV